MRLPVSSVAKVKFSSSPKGVEELPTVALRVDDGNLELRSGRSVPSAMRSSLQGVDGVVVRRHQ